MPPLPGTHPLLGGHAVGHAKTSGYLRARQVAELFQVSPATIHAWARDGRLPFMRTLGGRRSYPEAEVRALARRLVYRPVARRSRGG